VCGEKREKEREREKKWWREGRKWREEIKRENVGKGYICIYMCVSHI